MLPKRFYGPEGPLPGGGPPLPPSQPPARPASLMHRLRTKIEAIKFAMGMKKK